MFILNLMSQITSFKSREDWLTYQREYRRTHRDRIREINKKWREKTGYDWNKSHPLEAKVQKLVARAIKNNLIKPERCVVCDSNRQIRAHHNDYQKPYKITWFCEKHHREYHINNK